MLAKVEDTTWIVLLPPMHYFLKLPYSISQQGYVPLFKFGGSFSFYVRNFVGSMVFMA